MYSQRPRISTEGQALLIPITLRKAGMNDMKLSLPVSVSLFMFALIVGAHFAIDSRLAELRARAEGGRRGLPGARRRRRA